jgi:Cu-Zn family superoxide dismutase
MAQVELGFAGVVGVAALVSLVGCNDIKAIAEAPLRSPDNREIGLAVLREFGSGVEIRLEVQGLKPGLHGFHLHKVGQCLPPNFLSAGGHLNPDSREHGHLNPRGAHVGDLPNLEIGAGGTGSIVVTVPGVTLLDGDRTLLDADGTSLVIHAGPDDGKTDPAGNAGPRVACGTILELLPATQPEGKP